MNKVLLVIFATVLSLAGVLGQGQVSINNRIGTEVNARLVLSTDAPGTSSIGSPDWTVSFFGGPVGTPVAMLQPLDPAGTMFRGAAGTPTAGYFVGQTPSVPGVEPGGNAYILLRVNWPNGGKTELGPYTAFGLGGGTITPPNLNLGTSPIIIDVPELGSVYLILMGLGGTAAMVCARNGRNQTRFFQEG